MKAPRIKFNFTDSFGTGDWKVMAILVMGLLLTGISILFIRKEVEAKTQKEFESVCNEIKVKTSNRLRACALLLRSGSALFAASDSVTGEKWKQFYERSYYQQNLPGIQGLGYLRIIPKLQNHVNSFTKDGFSKPEVNFDFKQDYQTSVVYFEPTTVQNRHALGFDLFSEPITRRAMEQARDSDNTMITGKLTLIQESTKEPQNGILLFVPVYRKGMAVKTVEQRRAAIMGWVYSPFRMHSLFLGILGRWDLEKENGIFLKVYDDHISDTSLMYDSHKEPARRNSEKFSRTISSKVDFNRKKWIIVFEQTKLPFSYFRSEILLVASGGLLISVLLSLLTMALLNTRRKAIEIAEKLTLELKLREASFREVLENSQDASYKRNLKTDRFDYLSPVFSKLSGFSPDKMAFLSSESVLDFIHPDDQQEIIRVIADSLEDTSGTPYQADYRFRNVDGNYRWFRDKFIVLRDSDNQTVARIGSISDITNQKLAAESLRTSEEKYRSIFENIQDVFYQVDLNGIILDISPSVKYYTQYDRMELIGTQINDLYANVNDRLVLLNFITINGTVWDYELKIKTKGGIFKDVSINARIIFNIDNQPIHIVGVIRDITERKNSEKTLKTSEEKFRILFETLPIGVTLANEEGKILELNPAAEQILGLSATEHKQRTIDGSDWSIIRPDGSPMPPEEFASVRALKEAIQINQIEMGIKLGDHEITWLNVSAAPLSGYGVVVSYENITQRKRSDLALSKKEEWQRTILNTAMDGFWISDHEGHLLEVNQTYCKMIGYSEQELLSMSISDIEGVESEPEVNSHMQFIISQGENRFETQHRRKDGSGIDVEVSAQYQKSDGGRFVVFIHDISKRKEAEKQLKLLSRATEQSPVTVVITDKDGNIEYVNPRFSEVTGYSLEEVKGKNPRILKSGSIPNELYEELWSTVLAGKLWKGEFCNKKKNGETYWESAAISPIADSHGQITFLVAVKEDITEKRKMLTDIILSKKLAEESELKLRIKNVELKERNVFIQTILDNLPIGLALNKFDEGSVTYMNKKFEEIYGWSAHEISSIDSFFEKVYPDKLYRQQLMERIMADINSGDPERLHWEEVQISRKDGTIRVVDAINISLLEQNTMISTVMDITRLNQIQTDLEKARKQAEESDNLKSAFLNNISHEIRTPFNGILGFLSMLQYNDLSQSERDEYIGIINQSAFRLMNTINDIVEISQIQSGQTQVKISEIQIENLINDLEFRFKHDAEFKNLEFKIDRELPEKIQNLSTDSSKLMTILTNLISNAIKFTIKGSVNVKIQLKDQNLMFSVKDTGIGIPNDKHEIIFSRFIQADHSTTRQFEGSGLGLTIAKSYVEMLNGKLWLESRLGEGSTFFFTIPYNSPNENYSNFIGPLNLSDASITMLKILIAEDDEGSALLVKIAVSPFSHEILFAKTGIQAVEMCRNNPDINLILMDIRMPDLDGYEATRRIRQFNREVVIFAQTAFAMSGDREKALEAGCNDYISKPIRRNQLTELIKKYFIPI